MNIPAVLKIKLILADEYKIVIKSKLSVTITENHMHQFQIGVCLLLNNYIRQRMSLTKSRDPVNMQSI